MDESAQDRVQGRLAELERRVQDELERIEAVVPEWVPERGGTADGESYNVLICGAGLSGLSIAFGLKRQGVPRVHLVDMAEAGQEGPWVTCARMRTLRSPKKLSGPDLGVPALTMRSWFEAVYGAESWEALNRIDRKDWMDYLNWFRRVTGLDVENGTFLADLGPGPMGVEVTLKARDGTVRRVQCRHVVLATGMDGPGGAHVPAEIAALPADKWTHSSVACDDGHLKGKDVAVIGAATSSFDWAVTALENGATTVRMIARTPDFARTEVLAWTNFPGFLGHFGDLPDLERWRFIRRYFELKVPPTQDQYDRATSYPNFTMQLGADILSYSMDGEKVRIETGTGTVLVDHLLLGTGYRLDMAARPESRSLEGRYVTWADRFTPPQGEEDAFVARHPYLGAGFELKPRTEADAWVGHVHLYHPAALPSLGPVSNGVTGLKYGARRIVDQLVEALFLEDSGQLYAKLLAYDEPHFDPRLPETRPAQPESAT